MSSWLYLCFFRNSRIRRPKARKNFCLIEHPLGLENPTSRNTTSRLAGEQTPQAHHTESDKPQGIPRKAESA